ncbi:MAG: 16S rRNA (adenine(1518)-N(6)/adenine(1519)-N(6))-dimethyltransferase RsmA [Deltaproteobacteria bacterium]|nr:16S rRNA (adenine(1518)-N(6)/adenine(1519)-N(6))-dimethyltransferase RsmA [Deltaproteobacteria bacterium]
MSERAAIRALLARRGLAAHRERGQNFLVDPALAAAIADAAGIAPDDAVVEIGPGLGILTRALAARAARVVAIEIDAGLVRALGEEGGLPANVELLHADALAVDLDALAGRLGPSVRVVANLPYSASAPILRRLLALRGRLQGWLVLVQREMALRLVARPSEPDYGSLAVLHALCVRLERVRDLPAACFHPVPKVTSTLVRATPLEAAPIAPARGPVDELRDLERLVRAAFGTRRKTLVNALRAGLAPPPAQEELHAALDRLGLDHRCRAEALAPEAFLALTRALGGSRPPDQ